MAPEPQSQLIESAIRKLALGELGLQSIGFCSASPSLSMDVYETWIKAGMHATMGYLAQSVETRRNCDAVLPCAKSVIAVAQNYYQRQIQMHGQPRIARYALGRDYHKVLRAKLRRLARCLEHMNPSAKTRVCVDSAPILEREFAHRAGLGWFGKNTCLIDSKRGSWFFIGLILTNIELQPSNPSSGGCGLCRKCIDACPTGAIVNHEGRWQVDSRHCISYQTIENRGDLTEDLHGWTFGCDICQEVCPFNHPRANQPLRAQETIEPDFLRHSLMPSLEELSRWTREEWDASTRGSAIRRTGYEGLLRNARSNLS